MVLELNCFLQYLAKQAQQHVQHGRAKAARRLTRR